MNERIVNQIIDRIIMGIFIFMIIFGLGLNIYALITNSDNSFIQNRDERWMSVIVSFICLIVYLIGERIYSEHLKFLPKSYYYISMLFTLFAVYLGSYLNFYQHFGWWDTALHFVSGMLLGILSINLVSYFVRVRFGDVKNKGDIIFIIVVGVLVSISIAVFWEVYEYLYDYITDSNMQKALTVTSPESYDFTQHLRPSGRFDDFALYDTIKDQAVAVIGAIAAGVYSFFYFNKIQLKIGE